ncbi:MAG: radical SAM protein, partial [Geminicoccaceae bacterium]|nr:radical SAM protein [Geminicoccaceae bacterium]
MSDIDVVTFGCRLNIFESEVMRRHATAAGLGELVIVHTCAVTAEAERQARQAIRRARRARPEARIVVTGCAAQITPDAYAGLAEVDHLVGNDTKLRPETWQGLARPVPAVPAVGDIMALERTSGQMVEGFEQHTRAFVQVQDGCDHRCTFCVIPYGRGNSRSVPAEEVLAQVRKLVEAGYKEVVLTGVDL